MGYGVIPIPDDGGDMVVQAVLAVAGDRRAEVEMQSLPVRHLKVPDDIYQMYLESQPGSGQNTGGDETSTPKANGRARKPARKTPAQTVPDSAQGGGA